MGFSEKQEALVKDSWQEMKHNIPQLSLRFFTLDEVPHNNPKLKSHAIIVFKLTCDSAVQLREKGEVVVSGTTLKHLGAVHIQKGVIQPHFQVVKEALLRTVEEAMGEKWSEEMKEAWAEAYDQLAAAIKAEMNAQTHLSSQPSAPA
nr:non-symbiotic hemoglobin 2 [Ipomoea batatas]